MFRYCERTCSVLEKNVLHDIMTTCIILHNMIIKDEREFDAPTKVGKEATPPYIKNT